MCMFFTALTGLQKQSTEINNFSYSPVLDDELVSLILHANTFGFNDASVDSEKMGNPRLKPVSRPLRWELALCEQNKYQLFSTLYPLFYGVPVRERYGSTLLPATREQHDQNCTQSH